MMQVAMTKLRLLLAFTVLATSGVACDKVADLFQSKEKTADEDDESEEDDDSDKSDSDKPKKKKKKKKGEAFLADTGFRPKKDGFAFKNTGGQYPKTPPVLTEPTMVKMFGAQACVGGDTKECTLTLPAAEWAHRVNRYINGGQCEGMAVASLTMFKGHDKPKELLSFSAHAVGRKEVTPLIAEYWAYQMTDPVRLERNKNLRNHTPKDVADQLVELFKKDELATLAFFDSRSNSGHAVTPYAVEDKGNNITHIRIYDNNFPEEDRFIEIDRSANTWKYNLAAVNPGVPPRPWGGGAESHSIAVVPMSLRLKKPICPFCTDNGGKTTIMPRASSVSITDQEGRRVGVDADGKVINEIPGAEVVIIPSFLEGGEPMEPMFVMPADNDYDISMEEKTGASATASGDDDDTGVAVFTAGSAVSVEGAKLSKTEKDTLSIPREGGAIRYRPGSGKMPTLKLAVDDDKEGLSVRVANMKAEAGDEVELKLDRKTRKVMVQGGGKKSDSYDLELKRSGGGERGIEREEQKGVKFRQGESHGIETKRPLRVKGAKTAAPTRISRGVYVKPPPRARDKDKEKGKEKEKELPRLRDPKEKAPATPPTPNDPPSRPKSLPAPTGTPTLPPRGGPAPRPRP